MKNVFKSNRLIVPIYINEKLVLDMLAIMEDGFSMVSQVNYTENSENNNSNGIDAGVDTSSLLSKLLKINVSGTINNSSSKEEKEFVSKEKVHTNVSLLSKFITYLENQKILKSDINISEINIGDFIEIEGELQKNPLINYMDLFVDLQLKVLAQRAPMLNKLKDKMQRKIAETDLNATMKYDLNTRLESMPKNNQICHGDFNPSNIIIKPDGIPYVIDWAHVTQGNGAADAARTYLLFNLDGKKEEAEIYLRKFSEKSNTEKRLIQKWIPIVAAAHLSKASEEERAFLMNWIDVVDYN